MASLSLAGSVRPLLGFLGEGADVQLPADVPGEDGAVKSGTG